MDDVLAFRKHRVDLVRISFDTIRDEQGELFDMERLGQALERAAARHDSLHDIADAMLKAVSDHAHEREDDWTLLLIRRAA